MWYKSKKDAMGLVFIYDELMKKETQQKLKLNMKFVSLAYVEGYKLYHYRKSFVASSHECTRRTWGNDKVYGAVYQIPKENVTLLDAFYYYFPSQKETQNNLRDKKIDNVTLFSINSLDDLLSYRLKVHNVVSCALYVANVNDKRFIRHIRSKRYRNVEGIDKYHYNTLLKENNLL